MTEPASPEGVWDKEIAFHTEGPTAEYLVALQEKINSALCKSEILREESMNLQQDAADRSGQVIVQVRFKDGEVVSTDVYWPLGEKYTLISRDALMVLMSQVRGYTWHEGDA